MDINVKDFKKEISKAKGVRSKIVDYNEAFSEINSHITKSNELEKTELVINKQNNNKETYREIKEKYQDKIRVALRDLDVSVSGFENNMDLFVEKLSENYIGYHILAKAFEDPEVTDIFVINKDYIFVEKKGKNVRLRDEEGKILKFKSNKDLEDTMRRFLQYDSKQINYGESKIVDSTLFGDRLCSINSIIATKGNALTIRKHQEDQIVREDLLNSGILTDDIAEFFDLIVDGELNIICGGITGSGKTTTVRAITERVFQENEKRVLVCEDTAELNYKADHVLALQSFKGDDDKLSVPLLDLIYTALRQKPKYIVVGEVRGKEAVAAIEAMETGHSTILTMHGGLPWNIINRLVTKYMMGMPGLGMDVVERIIGSAVDYIFIQDNIPGVGRRITSCVEVSYDFATRRISLKSMFRWSIKKNRYIMTGKIGAEKANTMLRRGVKYDQIERWLEEPESDEKEKEEDEIIIPKKK